MQFLFTFGQPLISLGTKNLMGKSFKLVLVCLKEVGGFILWSRCCKISGQEEWADFRVLGRYFACALTRRTVCILLYYYFYLKKKKRKKEEI